MMVVVLVYVCVLGERVSLEGSHFFCLWTIVGLDLGLWGEVFNDQDAISAEDGIRFGF